MSPHPASPSINSLVVSPLQCPHLVSPPLSPSGLSHPAPPALISCISTECVQHLHPPDLHFSLSPFPVHGSILQLSIQISCPTSPSILWQHLPLQCFPVHCPSISMQCPQSNTSPCQPPCPLSQAGFPGGCPRARAGLWLCPCWAVPTPRPWCHCPACVCLLQLGGKEEEEEEEEELTERSEQDSGINEEPLLTAEQVPMGTWSTACPPEAKLGHLGLVTTS